MDLLKFTQKPSLLTLFCVYFAFVFLRMSEHLAELRRQYPGQIILNPDQLAKVLGSKRQTVYNQHSQKTFPIRPIYRGKTWGCSVVDIARFLDTGIPQSHIEAAKPKPGRPASPRQALKFQMFWDGEVEAEEPILNSKPSQRQMLKYQAFWDDVVKRMKQNEQKPTVIRVTPPRELL